MIQQVWNELTLGTINSLVNEMPRRLRQVQEGGGLTIQRLIVPEDE
jgi:hypothetical protein